ncbi:MAG TPA: hypothetical protein DCS63_10455 [Elusimicrobia bacterium]|nr:hypothetical protein [Elusimicrobiota bacterium]
MTVPFLVFISAALNLASVAGGAEPPAAAAVRSWQSKTSPHFEVLHQSAWSPGAISLEVEKMYSSMRMSMAMFAPWMVKERTKIYIYSSQDDYLRGEFKPPRWSKGLAYPARKIVVVYDTGDIVKLKAVIAHELSHLYFEGYFAEKLKYPPQWLNEGLAVYMEDLAFPEGGPWGSALAYFPRERQAPFPGFFDLKIDQLDSDVRIADWYLQSFGTVMYLYRPHTRLQFKGLCEALRSGEELAPALWRVYRVRGGGDLARKWAAWLGVYSKQYNSGLNSVARSASFNFVPARISSFSLTSFGLKK